MSTTRRPEDVTDEEIGRLVGALAAQGVLVTAAYDRMRTAIASGLLVPPPRERTQMERDEEEWQRRRDSGELYDGSDAMAYSFILARLFDAAKAAGVTY